jgi:hypothetical protein
MSNLPLTNISFVEMKISKLIRLLIYTSVLQKLTISFCFGTFDDHAVDKNQNRSNICLPSRGWPAGRPTRERRSCMHGRPADRERHRERKKSDRHRKRIREGGRGGGSRVTGNARTDLWRCLPFTRADSQPNTHPHCKQASKPFHTHKDRARFCVMCSGGFVFGVDLLLGLLRSC